MPRRKPDLGKVSRSARFGRLAKMKKLQQIRELSELRKTKETPYKLSAESHHNDFKVCFLGNELYPEHTLQAPTAAGLIKQLVDRLKSLNQEYTERTKRKNTTSGRQCQACAVKFATYTSYIDHIKVCPIQCKCGQLFNDNFYFLSHMQLCSKCVENDKKPSSSVDATCRKNTKKKRKSVAHKNKKNCNCVMCE